MRILDFDIADAPEGYRWEVSRRGDYLYIKLVRYQEKMTWRGMKKTTSVFATGKILLDSIHFEKDVIMTATRMANQAERADRANERWDTIREQFKS